MCPSVNKLTRGLCSLSLVPQLWPHPKFQVIYLQLGLQQCSVRRPIPNVVPWWCPGLLSWNSCRRHNYTRVTPIHWVVVRKHFTFFAHWCRVSQKYTRLENINSVKKNFLTPFCFSVSFFYQRRGGGGCRARDIGCRNLSHLNLRDHWMAYNTSASAPSRRAAPRIRSRDWFAHWLIHMSTGRWGDWC